MEDLVTNRSQAASLPNVSVVLPAYNVAEFIGDALQSVLAQTYTDLEMIVINDGSPDTKELEQALQPYQAQIIYLKQENLGAAAARNSGIRIARGQYVAFLDSDDIWLPEYLSEQLRFIERSGADLVYADALLIGDSKLAGRTYMDTAPSAGNVTVESLLALRCNVITSGVVVLRKLLVEVGLFDESIRRAHDFDLWVRLAQHGAKLTYQRKVLLTHRVLESGLSGDVASQQERALKVLDIIRNRGNLSSRELAILERTIESVKAGISLERGKANLRGRDFSGAAEAFGSANRFYRSWKLRTVLLALRLAPDTLWRIYHRWVSAR